MASVKYGTNATTAVFGIGGTISYGYLQDYTIDAESEMNEQKDEDGDIVLAAQHGFKKSVSGTFVAYGSSPDIDLDTPSEGAQVVLPTLAKKVIITKVTNAYKNDDFLKVSFEGVIYDFNTSAT